jgi:multisubunit Na+/H+ antiporter MnhE subunit
MPRFLLETIGWAALCCGIWLATLSGVTEPEVFFAAGSAIPCGILASAGRRALGGSWHFRPRWVLWAIPVVATLVAEAATLFVTAARGPRPGRLTTIDLPDEPIELANGREAAATLALCSTPGSVVADHDPDEHVLTVHRLLSAGPDLESVVRR